MTIPKYDFIHPDFKINGVSQNRQSLIYLAQNYIKEGEDFEIEIGNFILQWFDSNTFISLTTSGTTGKPKEIKIEKQAMVFSAMATATFFELNSKDKVLHCLPTKFIAGKMMLVRGIVLGFDMDIVNPTSQPLQKNTQLYDFSAMVPMQIENSIAQLNQIKKLIIGGTRISSLLKSKIIENGVNAYETYGMTETITHIAIRKIGEDYFTVLPNVSISQDENNCLIIDAPTISAELIKTNDIVNIINTTQFEYIGRIDNMVNSGGIKLYPEQIEERLSNKIQYRFFVAGIPDERLGEKLILIIESEKILINDTLFENLNKYEKPKETFCIPKFIETENGKIQRLKTLEIVLK